MCTVRCYGCRRALLFSLFVWLENDVEKETNIVTTITFRCACLCVARALNGEKRFAKSSINETPHLTRSSPQYNVLCMNCILSKIRGTLKRDSGRVSVCTRAAHNRINSQIRHISNAKSEQIGCLHLSAIK